MGLLPVSKGYKASFPLKSICELLFMSETLDKVSFTKRGNRRLWNSLVAGRIGSWGQRV